MEDMKNLIIQSLETRGVLGQIRAKIRSAVFKIVDEQEQKTNMGCGLKWENVNLYKISETKSGFLIAELIRDFMESLKMDYSLSVFISESNISPEKLKKNEMFYKMGLKLDYMKNFGEIPIMYFILYFFLESLANNPNKVYESFSNISFGNIEKTIDDLIDNNLRIFFNSADNVNNYENMMENNIQMNMNRVNYIINLEH
jgi:lisH domain-containing protein FOPNL